MQNLDPVIFLGPIGYIAFSGFLVAYWHFKRRLGMLVLFLSAAAYFAAIAVKVVFQTFTYGWVQSTFGTVSVPTGLYFGAQTCILEVGLAYLVARVAVSRRAIDAGDAEGYGVSLAFWENGVLLGALALFNLAVLYVLIATNLLPPSLYQTVVTSEPSVFDPPSQLLFPVALGILERFSSFLLHFSWGYLCVLAAYLHKRKYLAVALPMGLVDALVPFAGEIPLWEFEAILFLIALGAAGLTWRVTMKDRASGYGKELSPGPATSQS